MRTCTLEPRSDVPARLAFRVSAHTDAQRRRGRINVGGVLASQFSRVPQMAVANS